MRMAVTILICGSLRCVELLCGLWPSSIVVHHSFFAGGRSGKFLCRELLGSGLLSHVLYPVTTKLCRKRHVSMKTHTSNALFKHHTFKHQRSPHPSNERCWDKLDVSNKGLSPPTAIIAQKESWQGLAGSSSRKMIHPKRVGFRTLHMTLLQT